MNPAKPNCCRRRRKESLINFDPTPFKPLIRDSLRRLLHQQNAAFSLMELLIAVGLASLVLATVGSMAIYATRSSLAIVNYTDLDSKSRYGLDIITREIRQAEALTSFQTNSFLAFTNPQTAIGVTITYNPTNRTVVMTKTGQTPVTVLTECDQWTFSLYQRTSSISTTNLSFIPATNTYGVLDPSLCKLVSLAWKCSRTIMAQKVNTESVQAAQIVLRNKQ